MQSEYKSDFFAWTRHQAELLRRGQLEGLDIENLAEEIEDLGINRQQELESHLVVLLAHLLKYRHQPTQRGHSWVYTIREQRNRIHRLLRKMPSLQGELPETFGDAYEDARLRAAGETGLQDSVFPAQCPWTVEQVLDVGFLPEGTPSVG
jgi:hypothetical protein